MPPKSVRLALLLIAILLFLGSVLVNLVSEDLTDRLSGWLGPYYEPAIYIAFTIALALNAWLFVRDRTSPSAIAPSDQIRAEFQAIWPAFMAVLEEDLRDSHASVEQTRMWAKARKSHPGIEVHSPRVAVQFSVYHQRTVSQFDKELGALLRDYLSASDKLRLSANAYNQFLYEDLLKHQEFEAFRRLDTSLGYQLIKDEMYERSRELENALDALDLKLKYYRDLATRGARLGSDLDVPQNEPGT